MVVKIDSVEVDEGLAQDLQMMVEDCSNAESVRDEFKRIFWEQQAAACRAKKNGVRWHPLFIRWCLNIMLTSGKTYDIIRESGFIRLPSRRTLRDYTNWMKLKSGFNAELLNYMREEFKIDTLPPWKRYVTIAFDEMKIREDLVFNKTTGEITGFVDYGEETFDERFEELRRRCNQGTQIRERVVATHMLVLMVRGIFFKMDIPIAQFPTAGVSADDLVYMTWKAVQMLSLVGLEVICMVADGASSNRKFFACHSIEKYKKMCITYKAPNLTLPGQFVYFMVDVLHLMKTTRNAWSNSQAKGTRHLEWMSSFNSQTSDVYDT
ncbi:uncharacterized protein [Dysidea avara]|uniref:uncharacterized protein n=1 Tax=Dysidea avara TaxID=196820 RepID=UPI00332CA015